MGVRRNALLWIVRRYRACWSGRGVFARAVCTFSNTETCSAYALRVLEDPARSVREAVALARARLARCHSASVYRAQSGALAWGELHDARDAAALEASMRDADECDASIAATLRVYAAIAARLGDEARARPAVDRAAALLARSRGLVVREAEGALGRLERGAWRALAGGALVCGALVGATLMADAPWGLGLALGPVVLAALRARSLVQRARRLDQHLAACEMLAGSRAVSAHDPRCDTTGRA